MKIIIIAGILLIALYCWVFWEIKHAPTVDQDGKIIKDENNDSAKLDK